MRFVLARLLHTLVKGLQNPQKTCLTAFLAKQSERVSSYLGKSSAPKHQNANC